MINLTIILLNLALKVEAPPKPTIKSSAKEKKSCEDYEYSNSCCLMIMENHMEESIYASISKTKMQRSSWKLLGRNTQSSRRMGKMSYLIIIR